MTKRTDDTVTEVALKAEAEDHSGCPCLLVLSGKETGRIFILSKAEVTIGRSEEVDVLIVDPSISRRHAKLRLISPEAVSLEDLGSKNGTFFDGQRIEQIELRDGDRFQLGASTILKLTYQDKIEQEFQRQLYESATRDGLTGLFNKKFLVDRLSAEFAYCFRHGVKLSLCMVDIDHFKGINDRWGHVAGDSVLAQISRLVHSASRTEDIVCRYGGEEFVVLLREIDERGAARYAERIRRRVERAEFQFIDKDGNQRSIKATISVGLATLGVTRYATIDDFITAADKQLYQAKRTGRNRVSAASEG